MRWRVVVTGVAAALLSVACTVAAPAYVGSGPVPGDPRPPGRAFDARVERVVDGDTLIATRAGRDLRVRLIGIDAPESVIPNVPPECYGVRASTVLTRTLPVGTRIRAAYQPGGRQDRYGRELWDVWLRDGSFVQSRLVRVGAAEAVAYAPHLEHADRLDEVESRAYRLDLGLWGAC